MPLPPFAKPESARWACGHFDVQLIGGMVLHKGMTPKCAPARERPWSVRSRLSQCPAGQGRACRHPLTIISPNATPNGWASSTVFLGLSVGCIVHGLDDEERKAAYNCDITYATNNELGFDYLRDNMKFAREAMAHRPFHYAIVDEVDSILIDEARTPLIISGPTEDNSELYTQMDGSSSSSSRKISRRTRSTVR